MSSDLAVLGLGTLGATLAKSLAKKGFKLTVWDQNRKKLNDFIGSYGEEAFFAPHSFEDFVESLETPRKVLVTVTSVSGNEEALRQMRNVLEPGDCVLDMGSKLFSRTEELQGELSERGIFLLSSSLPSKLWLSGPEEAWRLFEPLLLPIAGEDLNGRASVGYVGKGASAHYVTMLYGAFEAVERQAFVEAYDILKTLYRLREEEVIEILAEWKLPFPSEPEKNNAAWIIEEAIRLGVPTPTLTAALFAQQHKKRGENQAQTPELNAANVFVPKMLLSEMKDHLKKALFATRASSFQQGMALLKEANQSYAFDFNFAEFLRIGKFQEAEMEAHLNDAEKSWGAAVSMATLGGVPVHVLSSALFHFETARREHLSRSLFEALQEAPHQLAPLQNPGQF